MKVCMTGLLGLLLLLHTGGALASGAFDQSGDGFVNNEQCLDCHARHALEWQGSDHAKAMQAANPKTVLGNFDNQRFEGEGLVAVFQHQDSQYRITVTEGGITETLAVAWTFGVDPLQQYLVELPNGQLQAFPVAWDVAGQRWFHLQAGDGITPADALHWRKRFYIANSFCIECHTTGFQLNYSAETQQYQSRAAGHNVNCQACHGPGENHIAWTRSPTPDSRKGWPDTPLADPARTNAVCASCHARRHPITPARTWAAPLLDEWVPSTLQANLYHPDGQILDEVFEYGSFAQSRMHEAGVSCTDCHNPHTLKPRIQGNGLCISCHETGNARFPSLKAGRYDTPAHHHHANPGPGSQCVDCHMPATTYMKVDPRRDHRFGIPRPDISVTLGTPNACNQCHSEQTPAWAADTVKQWFPDGRHTQPGHAAIVASARAGSPAAIPGLETLASNPQQPAIWRATAIELLSQYGPDLLEAVTPALQDPSALVRTHAVTAFEAQSMEVRQQYLPPMLHDTVRAVRMEAARMLAGIDAKTLNENDRSAFTRALDEYRAAQTVLPDHPEGYANLGNLAYHQGNSYEAIRRMKQAVAVDPHFIPAYQSLAVLYSRIGANDRAIEILQQAIAHALPEQHGELYYTLGLAYAERQDMPAARDALEKSIAMNAQHSAAHYNLALVLQRLNQPDASIHQFKRALAIDPADDRSRYALLQLLMQQQRFTEAQAELDTLKGRYPQESSLQAIQAEINQRKTGP